MMYSSTGALVNNTSRLHTTFVFTDDETKDSTCWSSRREPHHQSFLSTTMRQLSKPTRWGREGSLKANASLRAALVYGCWLRSYLGGRAIPKAFLMILQREGIGGIAVRRLWWSASYLDCEVCLDPCLSW